YGDHRDLHSFPTRRSSDLPRLAPRPRKCMTRRDRAGGKAKRNALVVASLISFRVGERLPECQILYAKWHNHLDPSASQRNRDTAEECRKSTTTAAQQELLRRLRQI